MARWLRSWRASGSASAVAGFVAGCILSVQHNGAWRRHAPVAWSALGENQSDGACEGVASWLRRRAGASRADRRTAHTATMHNAAWFRHCRALFRHPTSGV